MAAEFVTRAGWSEPTGRRSLGATGGSEWTQAANKDKTPSHSTWGFE